MADHNRWIKFYPRDWIADTRTLTTEEQGAYFLLWMESVIRDGLLPVDPNELQALALVRDTGRWKRIWGKIGRYFQLAEGGTALVQRRVIQELDEAKERVENAKRAGRTSAELREKKRLDTNGRSTAVVLPLFAGATPSEPPSNEGVDNPLVRSGSGSEADQNQSQIPSPAGAPARSTNDAGWYVDPVLPNGPFTSGWLCDTFGRVRAIELGGLPWMKPATRDGKATDMAEMLNATPSIRADVIPSMHLLFQWAKTDPDKIGPRAGEVLKSASFAFAVWCVEITTLTEAIHGRTPVASKQANGKGADVSVGHVGVVTEKDWHAGAERWRSPNKGAEHD